MAGQAAGSGKGARKALNLQTLEALGATRLAELVLTLSDGNPTAKRVVRLALAEQKGPAELARQLRKGLAAIGRAGSLLDDDRGMSCCGNWNATS